MKTSLRSIGLVLIVAGALALIYTGTTFTTPQKVVDIGPIEVVKEKQHTFDWSPVVGAVLIAVGTSLMFLATSRRAH